jgi:pyruvate decarboxylase
MSINQLMWSAIGYSVGAALGALLGVRDMGQEEERRVILIVGDGSLQISVQELSTMIWKNLKPTVFVLNNAGYTVERFIHGPEQEYNDINAGTFPLVQILTPDWEYTSLLKAFGGKKSSSYRVSTKNEADSLLSSASFGTGKEIQLVDVVMPVMDAPRALKEQAKLLENANKKAEDEAEAPPTKKRKVEAAGTTANGIGFHGLTNGAETLA